MSSWNRCKPPSETLKTNLYTFFICFGHQYFCFLSTFIHYVLYFLLQDIANLPLFSFSVVIRLLLPRAKLSVFFGIAQKTNEFKVTSGHGGA